MFAGDPRRARASASGSPSTSCSRSTCTWRRSPRTPRSPGATDEFAAAGAALNTNGTDIGAAIGSLFGQEAQDAFNTIWSAHNGFFVDYTTGVATDDQAHDGQGRQGPHDGLRAPSSPRSWLAPRACPRTRWRELITDHVLTTKAVVDAQGAGDAEAAAAADLSAGRHMRMLGDPLAAAIVEALPESFQ